LSGILLFYCIYELKNVKFCVFKLTIILTYIKHKISFLTFGDKKIKEQ